MRKKYGHYPKSTWAKAEKKERNALKQCEISEDLVQE